jgi:hypothetical protein
MKPFILLAALALSQVTSPILPASNSTSTSSSPPPPPPAKTTTQSTAPSTKTGLTSILSPQDPVSNTPNTDPAVNPISAPAPENPDSPNTSSKAETAPFAFGSPMIFGIGAAVLAIIFAGIAFYIIRRRKTNDQESLMNLRGDLGKGPAPVTGGGGTKILSNDSAPQQQVTEYYYTPESVPAAPLRVLSPTVPVPAPYVPASRVLSPAASAPLVPSRGVGTPTAPAPGLFSPVYTQLEIDIWNAQQQYGMYTAQQVEDWVTQSRVEGYTEPEIDAWRAQVGKTYTQEEIETWYHLEYFPQTQIANANASNGNKVGI